MERFSAHLHTDPFDGPDDDDDRTRTDHVSEAGRQRRDDEPAAGASEPSNARDEAAAARAQAEILAGGDRLTASAGARWFFAFALVVAVGMLGARLLAPVREELDGSPQDVISVELTPDYSTASDRPDDVPGPKLDESMASTSDQPQADDPDPPAPESPPPTEAKKVPEKTPELTAPPAPAEVQAMLPPPKPEAKSPDPDPLVEKMPDIKPPDTVDRPTDPSKASNGSAALLSGGRRPSAAAQASWKGEIGTHLVHHRRYPTEARSKGWQGSARVRVTINEGGHVINSELVKSTGRALLDGEAIALMQRSDPFPKPPAGMPTPVVLTVPVNFSIH